MGLPEFASLSPASPIGFCNTLRRASTPVRFDLRAHWRLDCPPFAFAMQTSTVRLRARKMCHLAANHRDVHTPLLAKCADNLDEPSNLEPKDPFYADAPPRNSLEHLFCHRLVATGAWNSPPHTDRPKTPVPMASRDGYRLSKGRGAFRRKSPFVRGDRSPRPSGLASRHAAPQGIATERTGAFGSTSRRLALTG